MKYSPHKKPTVYPQDIQCVFQPTNGRGGIYVGNLQASQNLKTLKRHKIKAVLTAARDIYLTHPQTEVPHYLHIPGEDHERFNLSIYFDKSADFIDKVIKETNVLVHCMAGISRSVSLVLAYLMKYHQMPFREALSNVRKKRRIINPNKGFIRQLQDYQQQLFKSGFRSTEAQRRSADNFSRYTRDSSLSNKKSDFYDSQKKSYMGNSFYKKPASYLRESYLNTSDAKEKSAITDYTNSKSGLSSSNAKRGYDYSSYADLNKELDNKIELIRQKYMDASDSSDRKLSYKSPELAYSRNNRQNRYNSYFLSANQGLDYSRNRNPHRAYDTSFGSKFDERLSNLSTYQGLKLSKNFSTMEPSSTTKYRSSAMDNYLRPKSRKLFSYDNDY